MFKLFAFASLLVFAAARPSGFETYSAPILPQTYSAVVGEHKTISHHSSSIVHPTPVVETIETYAAPTPVLETYAAPVAAPAPVVETYAAPIAAPAPIVETYAAPVAAPAPIVEARHLEVAPAPLLDSYGLPAPAPLVESYAAPAPLIAHGYAAHGFAGSAPFFGAHHAGFPISTYAGNFGFASAFPYAGHHGFTYANDHGRFF